MFQLFLILSPEGSCEGCFTFSERLKLSIDAFNRITSLISYSNVFFKITSEKTVIIFNAEEIYCFCSCYENIEIMMIMRPGWKGSRMWIKRQAFFSTQGKCFKSTRVT